WLPRWYTRRRRERVWATGEDREDAERACDTLYTALEVLTRVAAPLLPLTTEEVWRGLTGGRSVHLADWPVPEDLPADPDLVMGMDVAREICSGASALRKANKLRGRLPLRDLTVVVPDAAKLADFGAIIAGVGNVRQVRLLGHGDATAQRFGHGGA